MQLHHGGYHSPADKARYRWQREEIEDESAQIDQDLHNEQEDKSNADASDEFWRKQER